MMSYDPHKKLGRIVFAVIGLIVITLLLLAVFSPKRIPWVRPGIGEKGTSDTSTEEPVLPIGEVTPAPDLSEEQIEQIILEIVSGKREDVPQGIYKTKRQIIKDYLYECYMKPEPADKIACFEVYHFSTGDWQARKDACSDQECLDILYYDVGKTISDTYCDAIADNALKEECRQQ